MPTISLAEPSGRYLSLAEREEIASVWPLADPADRAPHLVSLVGHSDGIVLGQWQVDDEPVR